MRKAALLLSTILIGSAAQAATPTLMHKGFTARHVHPSKLTTLYDQTGNDSGLGLVAQNFESTFDAYDSTAADDFIVPDGKKWKIKEIDLVGTYFNGSGPAQSLNIAVYKTKNGLPGKKVAEYLGITGQDDMGSFAVTLPKPLKLKPGQYWVAASANMDFGNAGEWGFEAGTLVINNPAVWENPGDGFATGCTTWTPVSDCVPGITGDLLFALKGKEG
jgi:hypothetical protein